MAARLHRPVLWPAITLLMVCCSLIRPQDVKDEMQSFSSRYMEVPLDSLDKFHLFWIVEHQEETVTFELRLQLPGDFDWFGFGFSDRGEIVRADLCIIWVDRHNRIHAEDAWTDEAGYVSVDEQDDWEILGLKRRGRVLRAVLRRKFDTCDDQDYVIQEGTTHLVYATGKGPISRADGLRLSHKEHGFQRVHLLKKLAKLPDIPDDAETLQVINDQVHVPNEETTYWCSLHQLPEKFTKKHHILQYEAWIQRGNEPVVHHLEVFHCEVPAEWSLPDWNGPCRSPSKPPVLEACKRVLAAWAMGAPPLVYPDEAGLPIGGANFSRYVMLEIHYNNPELKDDWVDSSGVQLTYTSNLREFDAGVIELGLEYTDKMAIPPRQEAFTLSGYCVAECTRASLPGEGIVIFASQLHTHLTGSQVFTQRVRGGQELEELNRDNHYSTHFQEIRLLKNRITLLPGDALVTTCTYDTRSRSNVTLGGFAISEEMCVNYIHYYPKTNLEVCKSSIDGNALSSYFRYMKDYNGEPTSEEQGISSNYQAISWSPNNAAFLDKLYRSAPLDMQCNQSSGERFPGYWSGIPLTEILYPLPPPTRPCSARQDKDGIRFSSKEQ